MSLLGRRMLAVFTLLMGISLAGGVAAKDNQQTQTFIPIVNSKGLAMTEHGDILPHLKWSTGFIYNYAFKPIVLFDKNTGDELGTLISHRQMFNVWFSIGLFDWVEVGLDLPVMVSQDGFQLANTAKHIRKLWMLGDLRLAAKLALLRQKKHNVGMNLHLNLTFPTSDPRTGVGSQSVTFNPMINLSYDDLFFAGLNVGAIIQKPSEVKSVEFGHMFRMNVGLGYRINLKMVSIMPYAEMYVMTPFKNFFKHKEETPLEIHGGVRLAIGPWHILAGAGPGLIRGVGSPAVRAYLSLAYTTDLPDRDGDGIVDVRDDCPDVPEDRDGFKDSDGCPDADNDKDGICDPWVVRKGQSGTYAHICKGSDKCPDDPEDKDGFQDDDGCPDADNDKDGICDPWVQEKGLSKKYAHICKGSDKCPNDPEDKDGFQDDDGCPDPDNDKDGICDPWVQKKGLSQKYANVCKGSDKCPDDAEDKDGFEDDDGCPDPDDDKDGVCDDWVQKKGLSQKYARVCKGSDKCRLKKGPLSNNGCPLVKLTAKTIEIFQKVYFDTAKSTIKRVSYELLAKVAQTLKDNPDILKVSIEGHTDERGGKNYNLKLSKDRARAVLNHLVKKHGIDRKRLISKGFGQSRPVVDAKSHEAWRKNRRVEFVILQRGAKK